MKIFVNNDNYKVRYLNLICYACNIKLSPKRQLVMNHILNGPLYAKDKPDLYKKLGICNNNLTNTINFLSKCSPSLIRKVKVIDKDLKKEKGGYYYECTFPIPKTEEDLLNMSINITFINNNNNK